MTKGGPHDGDPVLELSERLTEEAGSSAPKPAALPVSPPPLPKRGSAVRPAATSAPPVDLPGTSPPPPSRPSGDPFQEPVEPRLPRGLPEEKLDYFRTVLKQKQETIARARAIYAEREQEADQWREAVTALRAQLQTALAELDGLRDLPAKVEHLTAQYERANARAEERESRLALADQKAASLEADLEAAIEERKQLSKALAEVEIQVPDLSDKLAAERRARATAEAELADLKGSLQSAEEKVIELSAGKSEAEGNLEAVNEQYQAVSTENERLLTELQRANEELEAAVAERDTAAAERAANAGDLEALNARIEELEQQAAAERAEAQASAARLVEQAEQRARREIQQLREQSARAVEEARSGGAQLGEELEQAQAQLARVQAERAQLKVQAEHHIKKIREELTASTQRKIAELQTALMQEEEKRGELERHLAEAEGKSASLAGQLGSARTEQAGARKVRDELASMQQRLLELQGLLQKERREKDAWEKRAVAAESSKRELEARLDALESALAHANEQTGRGAADADAVADERDQLKADLAAMKKKLVAAENAMEAAASLKAKVVRLEAQLKGRK